LSNAAPSLAPAVEYLPGVTDPATKLRAEQCLRASGPDFKETKLAYKARPLNGIWATAPYLHNGSVPTLYDLLLPTNLRNTAPLNAASAMPASVSGPIASAATAMRPDIFYVGSREFDEKKVGFVATKTDKSFQFRVHDENGQPIFGNYNSGHEFGTQLNDEDRKALVEYLKTL
jgi:cytochrome c peroxidase